MTAAQAPERDARRAALSATPPAPSARSSETATSRHRILQQWERGITPISSDAYSEGGYDPHYCPRLALRMNHCASRFRVSNAWEGKYRLRRVRLVDELLGLLQRSYHRCRKPAHEDANGTTSTVCRPMGGIPQRISDVSRIYSHSGKNSLAAAMPPSRRGKLRD